MATTLEGDARARLVKYRRRTLCAARGIDAIATYAIRTINTQAVRERRTGVRTKRGESTYVRNVRVEAETQ